MRLGGPVSGDTSSPGEWVARLLEAGYSAAYCPVSAEAADDAVRAYTKAAEAAGIVIAEVGAWSHPLSPDDEKRSKSVAHCQGQLALADRIGAQCCVNVAGSRGEHWAGHDPANLTDETFDLIVETVRTIIDAVKPTRTWYTLEAMPWMYPDSPDSYVALIRAIDRPRFAVHLDPVNLVNCPQRYYNNGALIRECFEKLGPHIKSCHAKDILMSQGLTVHLDEVRPGTGNLDYRTFLREAEKLGPDTPIMLEHLPNEEEYALAAQYVRGVAKEVGVALR